MISGDVCKRGLRVLRVVAVGWGGWVGALCNGGTGRVWSPAGARRGPSGGTAGEEAQASRREGRGVGFGKRSEEV